MFYFYVFSCDSLQLQPVNQPEVFFFSTPPNDISHISQYNLQNSFIQALEAPLGNNQQPPQLPAPMFKTQEAVSIKKFAKQKISNRLQKLPFVDKHNIIPNNINHILAFVQRKSKSENVVKKIIEKFKPPQEDYNSKAFYSYQSFVKNKLSVHVNIRALETLSLHLDFGCQIFPEQEQIFYNRVSRAAIRYYLKEIAPLVTLNSQRLKNTNKEDHLKVQRYLLSVVQTIEENPLQVEAKNIEKM